MRWRQGRRSTNIEDRRGRRGIQLGGAGLIAVVIVMLLGGDPSQILSMLEQGVEPPGPVRQETGTAGDDEQSRFVSVVLADTEDTWSALFARADARYEPPTLVLYTDTTRTACGFGSAATGPFYCPADRRVYLDLGFFDQLRRLGAPGDFARAYVIGHEVAHHVQNLIGTMDEVNRVRAGSGRTHANRLSVMLELQADCYAGVWAHHADKARNILEAGDIEEGIAAAAAVGDDRLQRRAGQAVQPDAFTHGSSRQRADWFRTGLDSGDLQACDTFSG